MNEEEKKQTLSEVLTLLDRHTGEPEIHHAYMQVKEGGEKKLKEALLNITRHTGIPDVYKAFNLIRKVIEG